MATLLLRFAIVLENQSIQPCDMLSGERRHGPLFHRWLPDGRREALELNVDDPDAELRVWFEQSGYVEGDRVRFDYERKELDAAIIGQQDVLDAGPLIGTLRLSNIAPEVAEAIHEQRSEDPAYVQFGRRVAQLIYSRVSRLLDVLRTNYGQYWVSELKEWNPREQSLTTYFSMVVQTKWSLDDGVNWADFSPDQESVISTQDAAVVGDGQLMTAQDWRDLQMTLNEGYQPKLGAELLTRTHQFIEDNHLREAIIQAVTAMEVALNEFIHRKTRLNRMLSEHLHGFGSLSLPTRLSAVATLSGALSATQVESALKLAEMYQRIVRDGWEPVAAVREEVRKALQTIAALLDGPAFKFPSYYVQPASKQA